MHEKYQKLVFQTLILISLFVFSPHIKRTIINHKKLSLVFTHWVTCSTVVFCNTFMLSVDGQISCHVVPAYCERNRFPKNEISVIIYSRLCDSLWTLNKIWNLAHRSCTFWWNDNLIFEASWRLPWFPVKLGCIWWMISQAFLQTLLGALLSVKVTRNVVPLYHIHPSGYSLNCRLLCFSKESKSDGSGVTWGWVNGDIVGKRVDLEISQCGFIACLLRQHVWYLFTSALQRNDPWTEKIWLLRKGRQGRSDEQISCKSEKQTASETKMRAIRGERERTWAKWREPEKAFSLT